MPESGAVPIGSRRAAVSGVLAGLLLFGDYLALSLSLLVTGGTGNWILMHAVLQPLALLLAWLDPARRGRVPLLPLLGFAGLAAIALGHAVPVWVRGDELTDYGAQKLMALFALLGPALLWGLLLGDRDGLPGARTMPAFSAPLLLLVAIAVATNPRLLTIEYFAEPPVFFGALVMPAHQPLAFCLTKFALLAFALDQTEGGLRWLRWLRLGFVGAMLGLVLLSGARSYALALVVALAAQSLVSGRRLGVALVGTAIALALFQSYATDLVQDRLDPAQMLDSLAFRERELAWSVAWQAFVDHPLLGVGCGNFAAFGGWHGRVYPHNLPLELLSEFGALGLGCFVLVLAPALLGALDLWRRGERPSAGAVFGTGLLAFGLIGALAVGDLLRNYFVFFAIGLTTSACRGAAAPRRTLAPAPAPAPAPAAPALPAAAEAAG